MTGSPTTSRRWVDRWPAALVVGAISVAVYAGSLGGGFVWDDHRFIDENPSVTQPGSWLRFLTDPNTVDTLGAPGIVRPLRTMEFAADYALFGASPTAFRLHSLAWHVLAAVLLFLVFRRLLGNGRAALAAATFWAVHPAQTESVAFISSRGDVAMGACCIASILAALRSEGFDRWLAASLAAAALAPMYKETAVALPIVIAALRWIGRVRVPVWTYVVVAAAYLVYRQSVVVGTDEHRVGFVLGGSAIGTMATSARAFGFYLATTFIPAQSLDWYMNPSTSFADGAVLLWLAVHAALVATAVRARRSAPLWTLSVAWFYAFLLPVANWPVFIGIPTAERFLYLSIAGVALVVGHAATRSGARVAACVIVASLAVATISRTSMWRSDAELWAAVRADHPSPRALDGRARELRVEALKIRDAAFAMPEGPERAAELAKAKALFEDSLDHAHRAIDIWCAYEMTDRPHEQIVSTSEVTAANDCYILGRDAEALFHAEEAIRLNPGDRSGHYNRAMALEKLGFAPQAVAAMRDAVDRGLPLPDAEVGAWFDRVGDTLWRDDLLSTAVSAFDMAVRAFPESPTVPPAALSSMHLTASMNANAQLDRKREKSRLAELDAALARLPKSCPARRPRPSAP